jgi:hypothetical protein
MVSDQQTEAFELKTGEIRTVDFSDLKPYPNNPRDNETAIEGVRESLRLYGYQSRIIVDRENVIIAGHTRFHAMQDLGWSGAVEVIVAKDLSLQEVRELRIADNKTGENATWNFPHLIQEVREMSVDRVDQFFFDVDIRAAVQLSTGAMSWEDVSQASIDKKRQEMDTAMDRLKEARDYRVKKAVCPNCSGIVEYV